MKKRISLLGLLCCLLLGMTACKKVEPEGDTMSVYYVNNSETKLEQHAYSLQATEIEAQLEELFTLLGSVSIKHEYKPPLTYGFQIVSFELNDGKLMIHMDEKYKELSVIQEVLVRAAIVRTLTQLPEVSFVAFRINNEPLYDAMGKMVGWMNADQFIENAGNEINTYQEVQLKLYFANETGTALIETTRTKEYNTNISLEKLIVEELIKGPNGEGIFPTINPETKVANVTVKDNICYVNLDESFLTQIYPVTPEVTVYSIVNSLTGLSNVNKVQILLNGETDVIYREKLDLATYFERNMDIITIMN
jgi:germination protein M